MDKQPHHGITLDGAALLEAYRRGGAEGYWRARLDQMRQANPPIFANFVFAGIHVILGEYDRAIDYLEAMVDAHVGGAVFIGVEATNAQMRGIPRFDALLRRIGAPQPQTA
jgi:hypothetical protein